MLISNSMQKFNLKNISNKNFILLLICISIIFLSISIFSAISHSNIEYISKTKKKEFLIYNYQMQKINQNGNVNTILFGDSSLGNAINNKIFSEELGLSSLNLALNEIYGFAGIYNLLKLSYEKNGKNLKNVILFHSFFFLLDDNENYSYFLTSNKIEDVLNSNNKFSHLKNYFTFFFKNLLTSKFYEKEDYNLFLKKNIKSDYIKQSENRKFIKNDKNIEEVNLKNKLHYLELILQFCKKKNINLVIVYGPIHINTDNSMTIKKLINFNNNFYSQNSIDYQKFFVQLKKEETGDDLTHVDYSHKDDITRKYVSNLSALFD